MRIFIVDDEKPNRDGIKHLLQKNCPEAIIIGEADSALSARNQLKELKIDVLLLDINMPKENGFDLLASMKNINFLIVFITAHAEHAIRAFKANAIDYILKPIDEEELLAALARCKDRLLVNDYSPSEKEVYADSLVNASKIFESDTYPKKFTLPYLQGFKIILVDSINYLEADGNYTRINFINEAPMLITKGIKDFETILDPQDFFRVHKSTIVNLHTIKEYNNQDGPVLILSNGNKIAISRRRLDDFMKRINNISRKV